MNSAGGLRFFVIPTEVEESLAVSVLLGLASTEIVRDVSTSLDMTMEVPGAADPPRRRINSTDGHRPPLQKTMMSILLKLIAPSR